MAKTRRASLAKRFCGCVKRVRRTVRGRAGSSKEGAAIAICTKSVLQTQGKTLRKFKCLGGVKLETQRKKR
jgi:hypothetical protein